MLFLDDRAYKTAPAVGAAGEKVVVAARAAGRGFRVLGAVHKRMLREPPLRELRLGFNVHVGPGPYSWGSNSAGSPGNASRCAAEGGMATLCRVLVRFCASGNSQNLNGGSCWGLGMGTRALGFMDPRDLQL